MLKANSLLSLAAVASLGLILVGCQEQKAAAPGAGGAPPPPVVRYTTVAPSALSVTVDLPGRTNPFRVAEIRPQVTGIVLKRLFQEGADIQAGDQLYQIDPATYEAALAVAQADVQKAEANLSAARNKASRYSDLVRKSVVSNQDYDDAVASLRQSEAQVASAKAARHLAQINLDYTKVFAPISGRIGKSAVTEGALVTANQATALVTIQQLDPIYVDVTQTASELMKIRQDMESGRVRTAALDSIPVTVFLNSAGKDTPYDHRGTMKFLDVTVDPGTSSVQLRAVFPNPTQSLLPGLFVRTRVEQGVAENAIAVPQASVVRGPDGSAAVWVINAEDSVERRPVQTDRIIGKSILITGGLKAGDRVVVEGLLQMRPGAKVKPVPVEETVAAAPKTAP